MCSATLAALSGAQSLDELVARIRHEEPRIGANIVPACPFDRSTFMVGDRYVLGILCNVSASGAAPVRMPTKHAFPWTRARPRAPRASRLCLHGADVLASACPCLTPACAATQHFTSYVWVPGLTPQLRISLYMDSAPDADSTDNGIRVDVLEADSFKVDEIFRWLREAGQRAIDAGAVDDRAKFDISNAALWLANADTYVHPQTNGLFNFNDVDHNGRTRWTDSESHPSLRFTRELDINVLKDQETNEYDPRMWG